MSQRISVSYKLNYRDGGFLIEVTGLTSIHDIDESNGKLHGDEHFDRHRFQLWDLSEADFSSISESDILEAAAVDVVASKTRYNVKVAFLIQNYHVKKICSAYIK